MPHARTHESYVCPGESHPISWSVHLSRLAAYSPICRTCPFRHETGQLSSDVVDRLKQTEHRTQRKTLFTAEGVRGVYLNELTRQKVGSIVSILATVLWESQPVPARTAGDCHPARPVRPSVVVGYDERPSSPDIYSGVSAALRRMGCQVIDTALITRPAFLFATEHLQASAGVYVTGAGHGPGWTGLDFVGMNGQPLSRDDGLDQIETRLAEPANRPTRQAGGSRFFHAMIPYVAHLWKHFHALRPLTVCVGCPVRMIRETLKQIFATLPCRLHFVETPTRQRELHAPDDDDVIRLGRATRDMGADVGVLIDDDGCGCAVVDERGRAVDPLQVGQMIVSQLLREQTGGTIALAEPVAAMLRPVVDEAGGEVIECGRSLASLSRAIRTGTAIAGVASDGQLWFRETTPISDGILTLARILGLLSLSDAPLSERVRRIAGDEETSAPPVEAGIVLPAAVQHSCGSYDEANRCQ